MATMTLDELVTQLRAAYGARLSSVVLYGSAAGGDHVPSRSDYNVLVLLDSLDNAQSLVAASAVARAWRESGNPPPMTMTSRSGAARRTSSRWSTPTSWSAIACSTARRHSRGSSVDRADLRLQLEQQVMGKLLQLRQGALLAGTDGKRQAELVAASLSTMMVLFRAVLRLHGETADGRQRHDGDASRRARGVRSRAVHARRAARARRREALIRPGGQVLSGYLAAIERLSRYLDQYRCDMMCGTPSAPSARSSTGASIFHQPSQERLP